MASIDILRDLFKPLTASKTSQGLYRHSHGLYWHSHGLYWLSQPLKHFQGLCSLQALNWLVIGNSQVLSHGCDSVVEAKKGPVEVVREPVGKTGTNQNVLVLFQNFKIKWKSSAFVLKNSGTNQNVLVLFQNFLDLIEKFCFCFKKFWNTSKRFGFVSKFSD